MKIIIKGKGRGQKCTKESTLLEGHLGVSALAFVFSGGRGSFFLGGLHELMRRLERMMAVIERALQGFIVHGSTVLLEAAVVVK